MSRITCSLPVFALLLCLGHAPATYAYNGLNLLKACEVELRDNYEATLSNVALAFTCDQYVRGFFDGLVSADYRKYGL